jgi:transposase
VQQAELFWGVDVAKAELVVACTSALTSTLAIRNDATSINAWLQDLTPGAVIAMESTGRYHQLLAQLALAAGMRVYVLNAKDVHFYAKALGKRGKTDNVDAGVIVRYVAEHHQSLHPWQPGTTVQQALWRLLERRAEVVKHRGSLRQTLGDLPELGESFAQLEAQFEAFLQTVDAQIEKLVASDEQLAERRKNLQTISGIGAQASALLAGLFSRLPFANADAVVAYSGLDPRPCDSGTKKGRRRLSKRGSAYLRRMLYLMAFAATRTKAVKPLYQSIKARGFAPTQALVILARKLLRVAFAVWKSGEPFEPSFLQPKTA